MTPTESKSQFECLQLAQAKTAMIKVVQNASQTTKYPVSMRSY